MSLNYKILYTEHALKQLRKLDKPISKKILTWLDERLAHNTNPRLWGEGLKGNLGEFWRYRIGDFRVICQIKDNELIILVVQIGHRRNIYND